MFMGFLLSRKVADEDVGNDSDEESKRSKVVRITSHVFVLLLEPQNGVF